MTEEKSISVPSSEEESIDEIKSEISTSSSDTFGKTKEEDVEKKRTALYWVWYNTFGGIGRGAKRAWKSRGFKILIFLSILLALVFRASWQEYAVLMREYSFVVIMIAAILLISWLLSKVKFRKTAWFLGIVSMICLVPYVYYGGQQYMALYFKYNSTKWVYLDALPLTTKVTPQPLNSITVLAKKKINESESVQIPDRIMDNGEIKFTLEISPYKPWGKMTQDVRQVFSVSAESPTPNFEDIENVCFPTGEGLLYWNNTLTVVKKRLNPLKFFGYTPDEVKYIRNDAGKIVQVVPMSKWTGWFFPSLEFGGVYILEQCSERTWVDTLLRPFIGEGKYIAPEDISDHPYLTGQNLKSDEVHRFVASSFRFQNGFLGPFPGFAHIGDVRIPDSQRNLNPQPVVQHVEQLNKKEENPGKKGLFAYLCLEPFSDKRTGLSVSLFQPGDGSREHYVYHHSQKNERLAGCSGNGDTVASSRKEINWAKGGNILSPGSTQRVDKDLQAGEEVAESFRRTAAVVESRPHIRDIAGKRRFYFLSTAVTLTKKGNLAGGAPELAITDPRNDITVWVDSQGSIEDWDKEILEKFSRTYEKE